jgi:hypothetical protein
MAPISIKSISRPNRFNIEEKEGRNKLQTNFLYFLIYRLKYAHKIIKSGKSYKRTL